MIFKYPLCTVANCPAILIAVAGFFPFDPCTCSCWRKELTITANAVAAA